MLEDAHKSTSLYIYTKIEVHPSQLQNARPLKQVGMKMYCTTLFSNVLRFAAA